MSSKAILFFLFSIIIIKAQTEDDEYCNSLDRSILERPDERCLIWGDPYGFDFPQYTLGYSFFSDINFRAKKSRHENRNWVNTMKNEEAHLSINTVLHTKNDAVYVSENQIVNYKVELTFFNNIIWSPEIISTSANYFCPFYNVRFTKQGEFQIYINSKVGQGREKCTHFSNQFNYKDYKVNSSDYTKNIGKKLFMAPNANIYIIDKDGNIIWDFFTDKKDENIRDKVLGISPYLSNYVGINKYNSSNNLLYNSANIYKPGNFVLKHFSDNSMLYLDIDGNLYIISEEHDESMQRNRLISKNITNIDVKKDSWETRGQKLIYNNNTLKILDYQNNPLFTWNGIIDNNSGLGSDLKLMMSCDLELNKRVTDLVQMRRLDGLPLKSVSGGSNYVGPLYTYKSLKKDKSGEYFLDHYLQKPPFHHVYGHDYIISGYGYDAVLRIFDNKLFLSYFDKVSPYTPYSCGGYNDVITTFKHFKVVELEDEINAITIREAIKMLGINDDDLNQKLDDPKYDRVVFRYNHLDDKPEFFLREAENHIRNLSKDADQNNLSNSNSKLYSWTPDTYLTEDDDKIYQLKNGEYIMRLENDEIIIHNEKLGEIERRIPLE